jgi:hypothetical protein
MDNNIFDWLDDGAWAKIEEMRQPKPMPPARKKKTETRYANMTPEKVEHKRKLKKKWMNENHERMLEYWGPYWQQHREARAAACRKWQAKFTKEHGVSYTTWRRWKQTPEGRERIAAWEAEHGKEPQ